MSVLTIVESILESPGVILSAQVSWLRTRRMAELKAAGVEYEQRIEELEKIEHPKPEAEFIYQTFNLFAQHHPWVKGHDIAPKSIARDMHEQVLSFNDYIKEYGLGRAEGVLLRYLTDAYRTLSRTVPDKYKTEEVLDLEAWLSGELRLIDASLLEEWEKLEHPERALDPEATAAADETLTSDITRDRRAFLILVRNACFRVLRAAAARDFARLSALLAELVPESPDAPPHASNSPWSPAALEALLAPYWAEHAVLLVDADARSVARCQVDQSPGDHWLVRQVLSDPEEDYDWALRFRVDLSASRDEGQLILSLLALDNA
jgi:superfamily II RNA helicase